MKSEFADWFSAQHGPRQSSDPFSKTDAELSEVIKAGRIAAAELDARRLWDEKRQSALYAWTARDERPNVGGNRLAPTQEQR